VVERYHSHDQSGRVGYSNAVAISGPGTWMLISGQTAGDAAAIDKMNVSEQCEACFDNLENALEANGAHLKDIIKIRTYLTDVSFYSDFARVRLSRFASAPPASTAVFVAALVNGAAVEIEATAFVPGRLKLRSRCRRTRP
jgi:2-iminobutanoate/2-iminopropanoate deaminase